ncbi:DUF6302 family protein [Streptomyces halstedii]|uniref:DUF6302 family protein n=1 Tax=Streptomyces halstedii TaxID=1944 RepID=UPI0039C0506D
MQWSSHPDPCFVVEWGERPLTLKGDRTATTLGRFYGYSEAAIEAFMGAASPPLRPCPNRVRPRHP